MQSYLGFAAWSFLAGVGIPLIGVLNSGVARSLGNPFAATAAMFAVAFLFAAAITAPLYGVPTFSQFRSAPVAGYGAGLLICFYALSATVIIPRLGAASFIAFILIAQLITSATVDQFGLFGLPRRPMDALRLAGLITIGVGIAIMEFGNLRKAAS
jgi:transporter family-2 protein